MGNSAKGGHSPSIQVDLDAIHLDPGKGLREQASHRGEFNQPRSVHLARRVEGRKEAFLRLA